MRCAEPSRPLSGQLPPAALFGLLVFAVVCASRQVLNDGDTFTHIAAGSWMLSHAAVLRSDPFSSTFAGQPWDAHEWLSEVLLAAAYRAGGLTGVVLLTAAAAGAAFALLARELGRWCGWSGTVLLAAGALLCALPTMLARPHVLALPLVVVWTAGLLTARARRAAPGWGLLAVMVAWANLHGGFAFGLALAAAFALEASLDGAAPKRWWAFVAAATGAAMLTPQGWHGLVFPLHLLGLRSLALVDEWRPMVLTHDWAFEGVVLGLIGLFGSGQLRLPWLRLLLLIGLLHQALAHTRHGVLFGLAGALILAEPVGHAFGRASRRADRPNGAALGWTGAALAAMVVARVLAPIEMANGRATPVDALAQVPPRVAEARVLNSNQFGGYLALAGLHPFIDGRLELFGDAFVADYLAMERPDGRALRQGIEHYDLRWAILSLDDPLIANFDALQGWSRAYADEVAVLFVRG